MMTLTDAAVFAILMAYVDAPVAVWRLCDAA